MRALYLRLSGEKNDPGANKIYEIGSKMNDKTKNMFKVAPAPHIYSRETIPEIMWTVFFCLIPSGLVSVYVFGISTVWIILTAIISAVFTELVCCFAQKKALTINDGSAFLTGLLLAYNLPAHSPLWLAFAGSFVSILFAKVLFGGLGCNIFNPALVGRVFLMASFPSFMTAWPAPFGINALAGATPLAVFKDGFRHTNIFQNLNISDFSYWDLFFGFRGGCIGEACIAALLLGAVYLIWRGYISWHIPLSYLAAVSLFSWVFAGEGYFTGNAVFQILGGGLVLGAFYMATDYVTGPITRKGQVIFGLGCGVITAIIRLWGGYPEGVSYAILLMNSLTPLIDKLAVFPRFGMKK